MSRQIYSFFGRENSIDPNAAFLDGAQNIYLLTIFFKPTASILTSYKICHFPLTSHVCLFLLPLRSQCSK